MKVPENLKSDPKLGMVSNLISMSDRTAIGLEWEAIDDPNILGYIIYRGEDGKLTRIGATNSRFSNHFLDASAQDKQYMYAVSFYTKDNRESARGAAIAASLLPPPDPISWIASGNILPKRAKIIFRPHTNERVNGYEIERRDKKGAAWNVVGKLSGRLHAEFIDENLANGAQYEYRIISVTFDGLKSRPSNAVVTATKKLPPQIATLSASANLIGKIDLKWTRLAEDENGRYRIWSSQSPSGSFSPIAEIKPASSASDRTEERGLVRYYKVTYIDSDGLESPLPSKAAKGGTLPLPKEAQSSKEAQPARAKNAKK